MWNACNNQYRIMVYLLEVVIIEKVEVYSTKAIKDIEGDKAELYVNFYLVFNRTYIFTFLIDAPNLSCADKNPIKLWKHFLIMLEEENIKYMRRYESGMNRRKVKDI